MAKTKDAGKPAKASNGDATMKSVKGGNVTKPSNAPKAQKESLTKKVVDTAKKAGEKAKKATKAAASSDEDSETSASSASSGSESESESEEEEVPKAKHVKTNGKVNGKAKTTKDESESESGSEDSEADSSESEDEAPAAKSGKANGTKVNGAKSAAAKAESSDDSEDDSGDSEDSDESDEEEKPAKASVAKKQSTSKAAKDDSDESGSDEDSEDSDGSSEDDEEEEKPQPKKRKAEEEVTKPIKKSKVENDRAGPSPNLFVGSLSWNVDETMLREHFESFGTLKGVRVIFDRNTGKSKGYGYVEYEDAADAAKAYDAMKEAEIDGRNINLDYAQPKPEGNAGGRDNQRAKQYGDQMSAPSATVFVGNVSFDADTDMISEAFSPYGTINGVRLPTDQNSGAPKGYGYVEFSSVEEATAALEALQGYYLAGRAIRLDYSTPRTGGGGGGGGGRGFGDRGRGRGGRGGFSDRGRGGPRGGRGGPRGGRGGFSTNRGGFGDFKGQRQTFD